MIGIFSKNARYLNLKLDPKGVRTYKNITYLKVLYRDLLTTYSTERIARRTCTIGRTEASGSDVRGKGGEK